MLESNTFRSMMLVLGMIVIGLLLYFIFVHPTIPLDASSTDVYSRLMGVDISESETSITVYQAISFYLKAKSRSFVGHY